VTEAPGTERGAVEQAALDSFEGWFDGDVERIGRALHPDLVKRRADEELGVATEEPMLELTDAGDGADRWKIANALWRPA
jgi:hypothetical protein